MLFDIMLRDAPIAIKLLNVLIWIVALLPALTFHEWAHGYAAYKLGDRTAKADGRLSLNPLDHIDPLGAVMMFLVGFGWAKPVPVNTRNFKKPKRDFAITSIAGPLMNFVVAFVSTFFAVFTLWLAQRYNAMSTTVEVIYLVFNYSATLNLGLGLFNLIPLPPLDGSNVLMCLLPPKAAMQYSKIRYYSHYIFLGLIILSRLSIPFNPLLLLGAARDFIFNGFWNLAVKMIAPFFEFFFF